MDLSSVHGPIRPPRRRGKQEDTTSIAEDALTPELPPGNTIEHSITSEAVTPLEPGEPEGLSSERIQILGLHTCNPIVSYCNQIFSCNWADQIGTELIFAHPDAHMDTSNTGQPLAAPLLQGPSFELLAANSVKILGHKSNIASANPAVVAEAQAGASTGVATPVSADGAQSVPRRAVQPTHQANFLARLQSIKAARGETDTVPTTFSTRRNVNVAERLGAWARTEAQLAEIHALNDRARKGDPEAIAALEQIMQDIAQQQQKDQQQQQMQSQSLPIDPQLM